MGSRNGLSAHAVFGSTNRADSVPDCLNPQTGPVYLEGRLVLSLSFQGSGENEQPLEGRRLLEDALPLGSELLGENTLPLEDGRLHGRLLEDRRSHGQSLEDRHSLEDTDDVIERYRLWDDFAGAWHDDSLEVLRFEQLDLVVRLGADPVVLWKGAVNTRAHVIPEPDLDEAGIAANQKHDLRWKRV